MMTYREFRRWAREQKISRCTCGVPLNVREPYTENGKVFCSSDCAMAHQVNLAENDAWSSLSDD